MSNRKDDHIHSALNQRSDSNDFDKVRLLTNSVCHVDVEDVQIQTQLFGIDFPAPIYINAMSGGSDLSKDVNEKLSLIAKTFGFPMATGSLSAAIKDSSWVESFQIIETQLRNGFKIANIGLSRTKEDAQKAIDILNANALQIHLNAAQEITMPEGDRHFKHWPERIKEIINFVKVPVIVKEVGLGMTKETIDTLKSLGVQYIDISGKGGTNFVSIENDRRKHRLQSFESFGISTVESLLDNQDQHDIILFASGGVRDAYDIVKALALGAHMVGLSGYFLKLVMTYDEKTSIEIVSELIQDIKSIMAVLNVKNIQELRQVDKIFHEDLLNFLKQRKR